MLALLLLVQTAVSTASDDPAAVRGVSVDGKGSPTADDSPGRRRRRPGRRHARRARLAAGHPTHGFWQYQPVDGRPAEEATEVLVWYAPDAIWFGIVAHDKVPAAIRATVADRDKIDNEDNVVIDIDTFHDRRRAFFFGVNPLGVQSDGVRSEGAGQVESLIPGSTDLNPDFTWESKGRVTDRGYEVEIRIPFKSLRYPSGEPADLGLQRDPRGPAHRLHRHLDRRPPRQRQLPRPGGRDRRAPRPEARGRGRGAAVRDRHRRRRPRRR